MADIELVIKIPEETYEYWKEHKYEYVFAEAIAKGVILPKGHGDLIDRKEFTKYPPIWMEDKRRTSDDIPVILLDDILKVDAIIKADGGNAE